MLDNYLIKPFYLTDFLCLDNMQDFDLIIQPKQSLKDYRKVLWRYRDLFSFLALRNFKVRYKQTVIGATWALPLSSLFVNLVNFMISFAILA